MRARSFVPWVLVAATALGGAGIGPVLAQAIKEPGWPPPEGAACKPTKKDQEEAKTLFGLGKNAHDTSNYTDAIKYYKDAYKRDCNAHLLLKNLGKVYEADAQYAQAVEAYKLYRARGKPTGEELDLLDAKIVNLSKKAGTQPTASTTDTAPTTSATTTTTTTTTTTATDTAPTSSASTAPTSTAPSSDGPGIVPWIITGVGGVLVLGGGALWISSNSKVASRDKAFGEPRFPGADNPATPDVDERSCRNANNVSLDPCPTIKSEGESAKTTRTIGAIMTGVGVVAVGVGIYMLVTGGSSEKKTGSTKWQVGPGPGFAGIGLSAAF